MTVLRTSFAAAAIAATAFGLLKGAGFSDTDIPVVFEKNLTDTNFIPDFSQATLNYQTYNFGRMYCAPVAVSNAFAWLFDEHETQEELIHVLASPKFMNTNADRGTHIYDLLNGIEAYAKDKSDAVPVVKYQGLLKEGTKFLDKSVPDFNFVKDHIADNKALWAQIGFYQYSESLNTFRRVGGHLTTVVGYRMARELELIIHDPYSRNIFDQQDRLHLNVISQDAHFTDYLGRHRAPVAGFWEIKDYKGPKRDVIAIIDGIIGLSLESKILQVQNDTGTSEILP